MIVLFVIGEPGIGKTAAIRAMVPMLAADSPVAPHVIGAQMIDATRSSASVANEILELVARHR